MNENVLNEDVLHVLQITNREWAVAWYEPEYVPELLEGRERPYGADRRATEHCRTKGWIQVHREHFTVRHGRPVVNYFEFVAVKIRLTPAGREVLYEAEHAPPRTEGAAAETGKQAEEPKAPRGKQVNARMLDKMQKDPTCRGWKCKEWASFLGVSDAAVCKCQAWKALAMQRKEQKARRAMDRHRQPKGSDVRKARGQS